MQIPPLTIVFVIHEIETGEQLSVDRKTSLYIIRGSFSQEKMTYVPEESKFIYQSKDGKKEKAFDTLEWLAAMCSHIPDKGEQMVRYYGYYSIVSQYVKFCVFK